MLLRRGSHECQYSILASALGQSIEDCRIPSFSLMQSYCRATKGQQYCRTISLETHILLWGVDGKELGCVNTWPMTLANGQYRRDMLL